MANSPISPRLIRWAFLLEASQSSRIRRASTKNALPAAVSVTPLRRLSRTTPSSIAFQVVDLLAKRRLRHVQPIGGVGEVQFLCGGDEVLKMAELHKRSARVVCRHLCSSFSRSYREQRCLFAPSVCYRRLQRELFEELSVDRRGVERFGNLASSASPFVILG